jgi:hypothetical protein
MTHSIIAAAAAAAAIMPQDELKSTSKQLDEAKAQLGAAKAMVSRGGGVDRGA